MKHKYAESDGTTRHVWDVERIWKLAEDLEPFEIHIEEIRGLDSVTWFYNGDEPTVRSVSRHAGRILNADTSLPPILTEDFRVFDGMHRIARHLMEGTSRILVKKFSTNPEPDLIEKL
ncbi:MAG: chromosome partitioning protein ParB [Candidatus Wallbacteria bacterium HGW-Wallbacteria-1]|jgi:hypothetical protein|uniref:Chromosome partitioning protein ParB n=1 Tax=Candidatus Wallbacteria bacterium HGW-Wallbacteria-1 TaxID=2013854 RepID=A0A2N1PJC3_9BACT|nr:MAG: chromosome partitioning protein ParB [Candidatus Wallbacteria bacterium HGW-Wallbacteria-1]